MLIPDLSSIGILSAAIFGGKESCRQDRWRVLASDSNSVFWR